MKTSEVAAGDVPQIAVPTHLLAIGNLAIVAVQGLAALGLAAMAAGAVAPTFGSLMATLALVGAGLGGGQLLRRIGRSQYTHHLQEHLQMEDAHHQVEELFAMTDMLQAAETYEDAGAVLMASSRRLLPGYGAGLYIFNNSRDRLDLALSWDLPDDFAMPELLAAGSCWALKRGKPHINDPHEGTLICSHHASQVPTVEIPMIASGQLLGLLVLTRAPGEEAFAQLKAVRRLGRALADSMSLALSNIALRERLKTQSLRDPLTGLYNRRYMEDALERLVSLGARNGKSVSVIALDLDNFKRLNDNYGHAKGDAVLRDVASQLVSTLRPTDVVCRQGGEELMAILPDCDIGQAAIKAEQMRKRIEGLSEVHKIPISASFGVASVPETAISSADILPIADAALYQAKQAGKNCVCLSERRAQGEAKISRITAAG